jgi:hypothetical protein
MTAHRQGGDLQPRSGNRPAPAARGDVVVDAFVRARLLGLPLLTLEAYVVVGKESGLRAADSRSLVLPASGAGAPSRTLARPELLFRAAEPAPGLARAVELVEQGAETLERSRSRTPRSFVR